MTTDTITQETADKAAAAITRAGVSKTQVADRTGIPYSTLNRKLNGHTPLSVTDLFKIAAAVGVPARDMFPESITALAQAV